MGSGASTPDHAPHPPPEYLQPTAPPPEELVTAEDIRRSKEGQFSFLDCQIHNKGKSKQRQFCFF